MKNNASLMLVTWEGDLTQFLVEAENKVDAIAKAIKANREIDMAVFCSDEECLDDINDPATYSVDDVDFSLLGEICQRKDCVGKYSDALVFNG